MRSYREKATAVSYITLDLLLKADLSGKGTWEFLQIRKTAISLHKYKGITLIPFPQILRKIISGATAS